jgi:hypothetical protein
VVLVDLAVHGVGLAVGGVFDRIGLLVERGLLGLGGRGRGLTLQGVGLAFAGGVDRVGLVVGGVLGGTAAGGQR